MYGSKNQNIRMSKAKNQKSNLNILDLSPNRLEFDSSINEDDVSTTDSIYIYISIYYIYHLQPLHPEYGFNFSLKGKRKQTLMNLI